MWRDTQDPKKKSRGRLIISDDSDSESDDDDDDEGEGEGEDEENKEGEQQQPSEQSAPRANPKAAGTTNITVRPKMNPQWQVRA